MFLDACLRAIPDFIKAKATSHTRQFERGRRLMSASNSRFVAFWAAHERRALVYGRLLGVTLALLAVSLVNTYRAYRQHLGEG